MSVLDEAARIVSGARRANYGTPERNFGRIATLWTAYFETTGRNVEVTPRDVARMMIFMKLARLAETPNHADSIVDGIGYFACLAEIEGVDGPG